MTSNTEFDIHSPFLFEFITKVIYEEDPYYCYILIEKIRQKLLQDKTVIEVKDFGAGSKIFKSDHRRVGEICKHSVKPAKYGQLLFRMVNRLQPEYTLELGTSLGITTAYLAAGCRGGKVLSIEGDPATQKIASKTLEIARVNNVELITGTFENQLESALSKVPQLDFVFIDGHHSKDPTLEYFNACLAKCHFDSVVVIDDIHWSKGMEEAWQKIQDHESVKVTIDLHYMGIVFLKEELAKQNFVIRF